MALKLVITVSKKVPGPVEYSSVQSSCSIEGEITAGQDPVAEAARLQHQAQDAVDRFLGLEQQPAKAHAAPMVTANSIAPRAAASASPNASQPYRSTGQRRGPALASPAQLRYLRQLLDQHSITAEAVCARFGVPQIEALRLRDAAVLINDLCSAQPARSA